MRTRVLATVVAAVLSVVGFMVAPKALASPADEYTGTHFGLGNIPAGCENDSFKTNPDDPAPRLDNACYHMRTGMNGLDSSNVDVLIMVPASPTASRDMRIIKQAVEMWEGGIHYLAPQMGVPWMKNMKFHISTTIEDAAAGGGLVTYPIVDPEIVIVSSNPVGGAGIGIDPWVSYPGAFTGNNDVPCAGVANPFDMDTWKGMPGYDHHGSEDGATVTEDCGGAGGNICFALTPAIDPAPGKADVFSLFDLVSHEFGHCLTIGHVGDGAENLTNGGDWSKLPSNDIMAYNTDPPGLNKCVSTLDVEGIAVTQSHYIDTDGNGVVDEHDHVDANEAKFDTSDDHFQVQHPRDHWYASGTGVPTDCPQPDLGVLPGTPTDWQPEPVATSTNVLTVTSPNEGDDADDGSFNVTGTVEHKKLGPPPPTGTSDAVDDADDDASSPFTEITGFTTNSSATSVEATVSVVQLPPGGTDVTSPTAYSVTINGRKFDSFVRYPAVDPNPLTWDEKAVAYTPSGFSEWDTANNTVTFHIARDYLHAAGIDAPYYVATESNFGGVGETVVDDTAPDDNHGVGIAGSRSAFGVPGINAAPRSVETVEFQHEGGNHFDTEQSTPSGDVQFIEGLFGLDSAHHFTLDVCPPSDVTFTLDWTDATDASDLDLTITGDGVDSGTEAASSSRPETYTVHNYKGSLAITVNPYLIADPSEGVDYTLTAVVTQVADDPCGSGPPPAPAPNEFVHVYLDGAQTPLASQAVDTSAGADNFAIAVTVPDGSHTLRVKWEWFGKVVATETRHVSAGAPTTLSANTTRDQHPGPGDHPGPGNHPGGQAAVVPIRVGV